ncbi:hypothetical protein PoB_003003400 [Plakobranchus ocellatus]|uniref:Uncharacterized protein n=1 Tax=Plakobranchus ocellatus TaxID=259542 RepID=A0AAV4A784_9GAST|nr:hypothetical protein PoB_003003400 [Plakobranchus ocellatus]
MVPHAHNAKANSLKNTPPVPEKALKARAGTRGDTVESPLKLMNFCSLRVKIWPLLILKQYIINIHRYISFAGECVSVNIQRYVFDARSRMVETAFSQENLFYTFLKYQILQVSRSAENV